MKKFSIPRNDSSVKARDGKSYHDTQNAIESIGDQIMKQVRDSGNTINWSDPDAVGQLCNDLDTCVESCKERFVWAWAKFENFDCNEKWADFVEWLKEYRLSVRTELLAVLSEQADDDSEAPALAMIESCLDNESGISGKMQKIMEEQGFNGSLHTDLQGFLLAISAGTETDIEKALRRFLVEAGRQAKVELRKKYDEVKNELRVLRKEMGSLSKDNPEHLEKEIANLKSTINQYAIDLQKANNELERVSGLLADEREFRQGLEEKFVESDKQNDALVEQRAQHQSEVETLEDEIEELTGNIHRLNNEAAKQAAEIERMKIQVLGAQTSADQMKNQVGNLVANVQETNAINGEIQRDFEALQITANRRMRRIIELQEKLAEAEANLINLMDSFKRVRKTRRTRSPELKPCSSMEQSRPTIPSNYEMENDENNATIESVSDESGVRVRTLPEEKSGLRRPSGVTQKTGNSCG